MVKKKEVRKSKDSGIDRSLVYIIIATIALALVLLFQFSDLSLTGKAVFEQGDLSGFNTTDSSWTNVSWSGSAIVVVSNMTSGLYVSGVFGDGTSVNWDNLTYVGSGDLVFEASVCSEADCSDASFASVNTSSLGLAGGYFQYRVVLGTEGSDLSSVSLGYSSAEALAVTINSPSNSTTLEELTQLVNISVTGDSDSVWYEFNGTNVTYSAPVNVNFAEGVNTILVWANDSSGEVVSSSLTFTIELPVCDANHVTICETETACTDAGGYWYNISCHVDAEAGTEEEVVGDESASSGSSTETPSETVSSESSVTTVVEPESVETVSNFVVIGDVSDLNVPSGGSGDFSVGVTNNGAVALFQCTPSVSGDFAEMIVFEEGAKNIDPGVEVPFYFSASVPEGTELGEKSFEVSVDCSGQKNSKNFNLNIIEVSKVEFNALSVEKLSDDEIKIIYSLKEVLGLEQSVELSFSLLNAEEEVVAQVTDTRVVSANSLGNFEVIASLDSSKALGEDASLSVDFNSEGYSESIVAPVSVGASIGGFAVFGGVGTGTLVVLVVVVAVLVVALLVVRRVRSGGKPFGFSKLKK